MIAEMIAMKADLEMMKSAFGNSMKVGPVEVIDPVKGYRLKLGDGEDGPYLSPYYPHPETGKSSIPLKKHQIVGVINPTGDPRQGIMIRGGYSDGHPSPNQDMAANVFEDAGVRITVADGALLITIGGLTHRISGDGITTTGGELTHDGKNVGSTHIHGGVVSGGSNTDVPSN